jgi:hypothetical protein
VIVSLMLKPDWMEERTKLCAEEFDSVSLVSVSMQPHPDEMEVIGHQAIRWAKQPFPRGSVEHHFAKSSVKSFIEPAPHGASEQACSKTRRRRPDRTHA